MPRASAVSADPWPRVTTRSGFSVISASPSAWLMVTGSKSVFAEVPLLSSSSEPQAARPMTRVDAASTEVTARWAHFGKYAREVRGG